jgi:hypothetical protein
MECSSVCDVWERTARGVRKGLVVRASAAALALSVGAPAYAQSVARFSLESVVEADEFAGQSASSRPQFVIDVSLAVRMGDNWQVYVRPWFRLPRPNAPNLPVPPWDKELYQAGVRYERRGPVAVRVDAGQILSPIGLGLYDVRPGVNPTIVPHLSYLTPMPVFDPTVPRVSAVAASYPLGAQLTVSSGHWDGRAAVVSSAPTRIYAIGGVTNPRETPVFVAGGGITPITGLRLGAAIAHGLYATPEEITVAVSHGRAMTMTSGEGEWAFGGTSISGEVLRTAFEALAGTSVAYEWFVQGQQILSPRWFVAARREGTSAPPLINGLVVGTRTDLDVFEATAGFKLTREVTLRGSYYTRRFYFATTWTHQAGVSVVWAQRWW